MNFEKQATPPTRVSARVLVARAVKAVSKMPSIKGLDASAGRQQQDGCLMKEQERMQH